MVLWIACQPLEAQGWPADYSGVMLQGFYWDSFNDSQWTALESEADELSQYFSLIWVPQSGNCNSSGKMMGYTPVYYFNHNSSFGTENQLRSMIKTFRSKGVGVIADVVINHRNNMGTNGSWVDYPAETYNGVTYQMHSTDICANDDGGNTKTWAESKGIALSTNNDTGEDWSGCRDLDHGSENVQQNIKAYLDFLLNDLGYSGFRYDMVKGFSASYIGDYNVSAKPQFSVGEFWSGSSEIKQWIEYSKGYVSKDPTSAAFDFQFRYRIRDAINNADWRHLGYADAPISYESNYSRYAVTFVENHDTEKRSNDNQDPIWKDTLAANAYMLAMPGTPCVFFKHWKTYPLELKSMIEARRLAGITNTSSRSQLSGSATHYAAMTRGKKAALIVVVGSNPSAYTLNTASYTEILSGPGFRYCLARSANTAWVDKPSGSYEEAIDVKLTAVSNKAGVKLVYTTDGTDPTPSSASVSSGSTLRIASTSTLKVGILVNGAVTGVVSRTYDIKPFTPYNITVYARSDTNWPNINFYAWNQSNTQLNGNWPGRRITSVKQVGGQRWFCQTFTVTKSGGYVNLVFSTGAGSPQTVDITHIRKDKFFLITQQQTEGKYIVEDVTSDYSTSLLPIPPVHSSNRWYDMLGRPVFAPQKGRLYIHNGRKVLY